jgi:histidinol-phosphate phosphatase family protein
MRRGEFINKIDPSWTLFLDRDGVLNERIVEGYVCAWEDWKWIDGALEALALLSATFGKIVVVTNQRGIAKGLYSEAQLSKIHAKMKADVKAAGGRIDAVYFCPHDRDDGCNCRKPAPGMLLQAAQENKSIDLKHALMVGDSISDMEAAKALKLPAIFIGKKMHRDLPNNVVTALPDLATFARLFQQD